MSGYKFAKSETDKRIEEINKKAICFIAKNNFYKKIFQKIRFISQVYIEDLQKRRYLPGCLPYDNVIKMAIDFRSNKFLLLYKEKKGDIFEDEFLKIGNYLLKRKLNIIEHSNKFSIEIVYKAVVCLLDSERYAEINGLLKKYFNQDYQTYDFFSICDILRDHNDKEILSLISDDAIKVLEIIT